MTRSAAPRARCAPRLLVAASVLALLNAVAATALLAPTPPPVGAIDHSRGLPGFCPTDVGVTVIVDFQQLGGTTIVRCNPQADRGTGLDALKGAGFQIEGVQRWGEAFICRIENRPSAVETVPIAGNDDYRERCIDTPPASGYWSYWHAGNNCAWNYSQWGVKNRDFVPGGFEAWSFSLNATPDSNPEPRIAAVRPGTGGGPCDEPYEPPPTSNDLSEQQHGAGGTSSGAGSVPGAAHPADPGGTGSSGSSSGPGGTGPSAGEPGSSGDGGAAESEDATAGRGLPAPKPRDTTAAPEQHTDAAGAVAGQDPAENVEFTGGEDEPDVREVLAEQSGASAAAPWVAGGVVIALTGAMLWTARKRKMAVEG